MTNDEVENERRGGLCSGMAAVMFWVSGMCFCLSIAGVSLDYWIQIGPFHLGLFGFSGEAYVRASQAFCVMGVITAGIMFISAVIYNFVHAVPIRFALGMFSLFAIATVLFLLIGIASFAGVIQTNGGFALLHPSYAVGCITVAQFMACGCALAVSKERKRTGISGISRGREFTETNDEGQTKVHRVGLCTGMAAAIFWQSGMCFCLSIAGVSLDYWIQIGPFHLGLFGFSGEAYIRASQAFCVMGVITAGIMFISAVIYNLVHAVKKGFALGMFSFFAVATVVFFFIGISCFVGGTAIKEYIILRPSYAFGCIIAAMAVAGACEGVALKQQKRAKEAGMAAPIAEPVEMAAYPQMGGNQPMAGNQQMAGYPQMVGNPPMAGNQQMAGNQNMAEYSQIGGNPQMTGNQQMMGYPQMAGNPQIAGNQQMAGNQHMARYSKIWGNAQMTGYPQMAGNQQMAGYPQMAGNPHMSGYQQMAGYPQMAGNPHMSGYQQMAGNQQRPGRRY